MLRTRMRYLSLAATVIVSVILIVPNQFSCPTILSLWIDDLFIDGWTPPLNSNGKTATISTEETSIGVTYVFLSPIKIQFSFPKATYLEIRYVKSNASQGNFWVRLSYIDASDGKHAHSFGDQLQCTDWHTTRLDIAHLIYAYYGHFPRMLTSIQLHLEPSSTVEIDWVGIYVVDRTIQSTVSAMTAAMGFITAGLFTSSTSIDKRKRFFDAVMQGRMRFLLPVTVVILAKAIAFAWLYNDLLVSSQFTNPLDLLMRFDSYWYVRILTEGYAGLSYNFFPGYPALAYIFKTVIGSPELSLILVSLVFGILCIPAFQLVAEHYMSRLDALEATFLLCFFPIVFLFTTIAYSESLFLFSSLMCWYLYLRGHVFLSSVSAGVAAITRPYGSLIVGPIFLDLLKRRKWKEISRLVVPACAVFGWLFYGFYSTGDWFVFRKAQEMWELNDWLRVYILPFLMGSAVSFDPTRLVFIVLVGYLILASWRVDWRVGLYGTTLFLSILAFASPRAYLRYLSFIFSTWLCLPKTRSVRLMICLCIFFFIHALAIWYQFLTGGTF